MKIKKVDDKPMVIHTKEKAKIHAHEPKGAKIKGSNIYTVERGPKVHAGKANEMDKSICKINGSEKCWWKAYLSQEYHSSVGGRRIRDLSRFKQNLKRIRTLPSRPRTPIFTLQEELEHLQPGQ